MHTKLIFLSAFVCCLAHAELKIVTSTTTLASVTKSIAGNLAKVTSITKGPQDPHYVEAKPSYMLLLRDADLYIANGLDLEVGWLSNVLRGAKNPNILEGSTGFLNAGEYTEALEVPVGKINRAEGDVHPLGNPHFLLDPKRIEKLAIAIQEKLSALDAKNKSIYKSNSESFIKTLKQKVTEWKIRIKKTGVKTVITYHKTLNYFLDFSEVKLASSIEPKPGIPPTPKHVLGLLETIRSHDIKCILVESFFETDSAAKLKKDTGIAFFSVPTEVESTPEAKDYFSLIDSLVTSLEKCSKN